MLSFTATYKDAEAAKTASAAALAAALVQAGALHENAACAERKLGRPSEGEVITKKRRLKDGALLTMQGGGVDEFYSLGDATNCRCITLVGSSECPKGESDERCSLRASDRRSGLPTAKEVCEAFSSKICYWEEKVPCGLQPDASVSVALDGSRATVRVTILPCSAAAKSKSKEAPVSRFSPSKELLSIGGTPTEECANLDAVAEALGDLLDSSDGGAEDMLSEALGAAV